MKTQRQLEQSMRNLISKQADGNQSIIEFCLSHKILPTKFYYWKRKLKSNNRKKAEKFTATNKSPNAFIPISLPAMHNPDNSEMIELQFPTGLRVCIPTSTGPAVVKTIIKAGGR